MFIQYIFCRQLDVIILSDFIYVTREELVCVVHP